MITPIGEIKGRQMIASNTITGHNATATIGAGVGHQHGSN